MKVDYQQLLLDYCRNKYPLSEEVVSAYKKCPRHKFIHQHYSMEEMYSDYPLTIYEDDYFVSSISQPSFVLLMIDMLELKPFHKVLEIGAGSGWNAALMSCLAEKVVSIEIIPSLARETRNTLHALGFNNVDIITGDGAIGYSLEAPYDRGIFTAGATDLPLAFHYQIKVGGKLLFVLKTHHGDLLLTLIKEEDHFREVNRLLCSFVPMKGEKEAHITSDLDHLVQDKHRIKIYPADRKGERDSLFSTT